MDAGLGAEGGQDLIWGLDGMEHDARNALLLELGEVGSRVVFTLEVLAPVGLCRGVYVCVWWEEGREGG